MNIPKLIYCADGNKRFAEIAKDYGFMYGAQPLRKFHLPLEFSDVDPNNIPPKNLYVDKVKEHRPTIATVKDWDNPDELNDVLEWAEEIAPFVETVVIIPKVIGGISRLPKQIGGTEVRLGYSVPTGHGATSVPVWEFFGWPVHLLGGSPQKQMMLSYYLNVVSVDGNMIMKMATGSTRSGIVACWQSSKIRYEKGHWVSLDVYREMEFGLPKVEEDAPYVAFEYSCKNVKAYWEERFK